MSIPDIFKKYGEAHFRALEKETTKTLSEKNGVVIATGGGTVMSCFGCINRCPNDAIDIKGKSEGRRRYVCPESEA